MPFTQEQLDEMNDAEGTTDNIKLDIAEQQEANVSHFQKKPKQN